MVGVSGTSKTSKVHSYYKCKTVLSRKSCDKKTVRKTWIERKVVELTQKYVLQDDVIDRIADRIIALHNADSTRLPHLQKQLDDVQKRINNLLNAIEEGLLNASAKERLDGLESAKADLEIAIAKEKIEKPPLTKEKVVLWISRFKGGDIDDPEYCKSLIDIFVNSVYLYDDLSVIVFNVKDEVETVMWDDLEVAGLNDDENWSSYLDGQTPPSLSQARTKF